MSKNTVRSEMAERIVLRRKELNLTQQDMADKLEIKRTRYARYETNVKPPVIMTSKIAQILGVTVDELINGLGLYDIRKQNLSNTGKIIKLSSGTDYTPISNQPYDNALSEKEIELIVKYRSLSDEQRNYVKNFIDSIKND